MTAPNRLYAGDTLEFGLNVLDYPPADGWTLKMRFAPRFTTPTQAAIDITAAVGPVTVDGEVFDFAVQVTPATTATWKAGAYGWHSWVEKAGARQTLEGTQYQGELTVLADPATLAQGADTRSAARKALDDALAALAAWSPTYREHTIGDRTVKFNAVADVRAVVQFWQNKVDAEIAAETGRATGPLGRMRYGVPG